MAPARASPGSEAGRRALSLSPGRWVTRRKKPVGERGGVRRGWYSQHLEQLVEVKPDLGRVRAVAADAPCFRELRLRGRSGLLRPAGLDAVASVEHRGD